MLFEFLDDDVVMFMDHVICAVSSNKSRINPWFVVKTLRSKSIFKIFY